MNRAVEVNGDYQNIAHISPEGEITFYGRTCRRALWSVSRGSRKRKAKGCCFAGFYQAYLKTKADNPSSLLLYQMGDFFEAYAEDAEVSGLLLTWCRRPVPSITTPVSQW